MPQTNDQGETFARWLLAQTEREGLVGQLVAAAKADRGLSKDASPEDMRARLRAAQADGDMFEAIDDAEADWLNA